MRRLAWLLLLAASAASCADESFTVRFAPEYPRAATRLSVLGVYKDGRMSAEAWDELGAPLSSPFATKACEAEYDNRLVVDDAALAEAVDDYARANGVTDDLLEQLSPAAEGDAILVLTVAGRHAKPAKGGGPAPKAPPAQPAMTRGGGRRGRGGGGGGPGPSAARPSSGLELTASLYSRSMHRSVALIAMSSTGEDDDAAMKAFLARLGRELPGSTCSGWLRGGTVDAEKIRAIAR